jgi:CRISPR/Cas system CSM-associated protein Csm4 (group 5 of RAMP superfamily)
MDYNTMQAPKTGNSLYSPYPMSQINSNKGERHKNPELNAQQSKKNTQAHIIYRIQLFPPLLSQIVPKKPGIRSADETGANELRKREGFYAEEVAGDTGEGTGNVIGAH